LKQAIDQKKEIIVLEEINRTRFSQALVGILIDRTEVSGREDSILLRDVPFFIPSET